MLYVDQILKLEKENRIVAFDGRPKDMLGMPYAVHMLRTEEVAEAILRISYVDGMLAAERLRDEDKPPAEEWRLAIMELVALERGEKRPSTEWMYKMRRIEHEVSALNRFVKFAPIRSKGNRKPRFDAVLHEIKWKAIEDSLKAKLKLRLARHMRLWSGRRWPCSPALGLRMRSWDVGRLSSGSSKGLRASPRQHQR